jgi:clan AA aspartic protease (TIGR02281 family)
VRRRAWTRWPALILAAGLFALTAGPGREARAESSETLTGLVLSSNSVALEGAVVSLEGFGSVTTDAAGRFAFYGVSPGNYRMTVSKQGFPDDKRLIHLQVGRLNKVSVVLAGAAARPSTPTAVGVPIVRRGGAIFVRGRINEQVDILFLVDTGASLCVLTKATADRLGLTVSPVSSVVTLHSVSGSFEAPLIQVDLIRIGNAEVRSADAIIHDVPNLPFTVGGILGMSFLNQFKVEIDQEEGVMLLSR